MGTDNSTKIAEKAQKEVLKYYPLVTGLMWLFGIPVLGGLACVVLSVVLTDAETVGRVIMAAAGVAMIAAGLGGFFKQYVNRKELVGTVIGFRDTWTRIKGAAPIAICDGTDMSDPDALQLVCTNTLLNISENSMDKQTCNILVDRVFQSMVFGQAMPHSQGDLCQYFQPITFVTLRDVGTIYDSKGRKLHGSAFGCFINIEAPEVSVYSIPDDPSIITIEKSIGLIVHELKHRVLKKINPGWNEDAQHELMGE